MKSIDKNVLMLGWVSYFTDMASAMINPILPVFVVSMLHEGMDKLGLIVAVATVVSYALRIFSGYISDRYGIVKPLVVGGYALSALSKPLLGMTHDYKSIAVLKALERFGKGMRSSPKDLMISKYSKSGASGKTFGFHKSMDIAGELSGIVLLFGVLWFFGQSETVIRTLFCATLIPGIIGVVIVLFFVQDIPKTLSSAKSSFKLTKHDWHVIFSLIFYFLFIFFMFSDAFFTMQAKEIGIPVVYIPLLFALSSAVQTLTSYGFGVLIDRFGARLMLLFSYIFAMAAQILLYVQKPLYTWGAFLFFGLFTVASLNANRAFISENADSKGSVYGVFYAGIALFGAAGTYIVGKIWEMFGIDAALRFSMGGMMILSILFVVVSVRKVYMPR